MSAQTETTVVRFVETALVRVHNQTAQEVIADQLGYLCHSPISRKLEKVRDGKVGGLLETYTGRELISLAMRHGALADALRAVLNSAEPIGVKCAVEETLARLGQRFSGECGDIFGDLGDGRIDAREADRHLDALDQIAAHVADAKAQLLLRKDPSRRSA